MGEGGSGSSRGPSRGSQSPVNVTSGTAYYWLARSLPLTVPSHDIKHENTMSMAFVALKV